MFGTAYSPRLFFKPRSLLSSSNLLHVYPLILQECKCARTNPREREGFFPSYPVFPPDSPLPLPFLPHSSVSPLLPPSFLSPYLCWIFVLVTLKSFTGSQNYTLPTMIGVFLRPYRCVECISLILEMIHKNSSIQVSLVLCEVKI